MSESESVTVMYETHKPWLKKKKRDINAYYKYVI